MLIPGYIPPGRYPRKDGEHDAVGLWVSFIVLAALIIILYAVSAHRKAQEASANVLYCEKYAAGELADRRPDHDKVCSNAQAD